MDAHLQLRGNLQHPQIGGNIRFSRGTASLNPQASAPVPSGSAGTDSQVAEPDIVSKAFKALAAHNDGLARQLDRLEVLHVRLFSSPGWSLSLLYEMGPSSCPSDSQVHATRTGKLHSLLSAFAKCQGLTMASCTVPQVEQPPLVQPAVAEQVVLRGLKVQLGPDLRASYPVVMNFTIGGEVVLNGPAQMDAVQLAGIVKLDTGEVGR